MKKRFVVAIDGRNATDGDREQITSYFKRSPHAWWHWLQDIWLVSTHDPVVTTSSIRDDLNIMLPNVHKLVLELQSSGDWAILGDKKSFRWLHDTWTSI